MAALLKDGDRLPFCGAVLISNQWVATSAHCLINMEAELGSKSLLKEKIMVIIFIKNKNLNAWNQKNVAVTDSVTVSVSVSILITITVSVMVTVCLCQC